ncbi:MAG: HAD family hydrolase [Cyanophyceae cyanobacterium]
MLSAILFDLDGTLTNTDPLHFATWQEVLAELGLSIDRTFYDQRISGRLNSAIVQDILPKLKPEAGMQVADDKERRFRQQSHQLQPLPGLAELLQWVASRQLKQAVVTNAPRANAQFMLEALQLTAAFPTVVLAEEAAQGKPDPAPYQLALSRLGVTCEEAIAFEDSPSGVRSAVGAGLSTIGVASTHVPTHLQDAGAAMVITDFTEPKLWEWLAKL